jgi:DNA (cytosine-5)-methyltransferase 1
MTMKDGKKFIDAILEDFKELGYSTTLNAISAKDFGVPQDRKRVIIIGNRNGKIAPNLIPTTSNKYITVRDVIGDLEKLESNQKSVTDSYHFALDHSKRHINWLKGVPEGHSAHEYKPGNGMTAKGYGTTYKRIWWDRPSPTVTTCFSSISSQNNVHPEQTRALTIREAMRIQTFPDTFQFE